jgi:serine/threonine protein kinase
VEAGAVVGGKYHLVKLLGQGGMGAVFDAIHAKTGRRVAVKMIHERGLVNAGRSALQRFEREARAVAAIDSLHVVQVLDSGEDEGTGLPFLVLEFLAGDDLKRLLRVHGALPEPLALKIAVQIARGLVRAHANDVVHRDLKPPNVFLAKVDGGTRLVKILDFGIAKLVGEAQEATKLTTADDLIGSPSYMSPEQMQSPLEVDARTDIWALGVVLYEMLSGATPTAAITDFSPKMHAICNDPAPRLARVKPAVADLVERALKIDRSARFGSAAAMLAALEAVAPSSAEIREGELDPGTITAAMPAPAKRSRAWLLAPAAAVAIVGGYALSTRHAEPEFPPPPPLPSAAPVAVSAPPPPPIEAPSATTARPLTGRRLHPKRDAAAPPSDGRDHF